MSRRLALAVPVAADALAGALDAHADYRVLRRMRPMRRREPDSLRTGVVSACALDVETTGLDHGRDRIIELAMQPFHLDGTGRIVGTGRARTWFEDPGVPLSEAVTRLTGLTNANLRGRTISDGEAGCMVGTADVVVAHNAAFDRSFVERRLPGAAGGRWICSMRDLDWRGHGFEGASLSHLLAQMGWFYEGHRASADVTALLHLLDHALPDGRTVIKALIERASRPTFLVEAVDAPFGSKELLKSRGYRWNAERRAWAREVAPGELDDEVGWASARVYDGERSPTYRQVTWRERYA